MRQDALRPNVESPCVRNCCLDDQDICLGCFRSMAEIMSWRSSSDEEKKDILARCRVRREERASARARR